MGEEEDRARAEGRRDEAIDSLKERVRSLESNLKWGVATILGLIAKAISDLLAIGGPIP